MFEFKLPDLGEGIKEGELIQWHVNQGDAVEEDAPLCDMETDKAMVTIPSPRTGIIARLFCAPGEIIQVNQVLVAIAETSAEQGSVPLSHAEAEATENRKPEKKAIAAPAVRRVAREMGIDIQRVAGTGPGGRVTREDLAAHSQTPDQEAIEKSTPPLDLAAESGPIPFLEIAPLPDYAGMGPVETLPMKSLRRKTAIKTTSSSILVPHVAHMDEIDVTALEKLRHELNLSGEKHEKLTLLPFVVRAVASLLREFPEFNSSVDWEKKQIIFKKFYHMGFAADTPRGLMVPVVYNADQKNIRLIAQEIRALSQKGQQGTITPADLSNSTFTLTNVGAVGGTHVFPIINYPETAILGMGRVREVPMVRNHNVVPGQVLPVTLGFDHRVADGVRAARFVSTLKQMLEDPGAFMTRV